MAKKNLSSEVAMSQSEYVAAICNLHLPRYSELPQIDLYMDQMLSYVGDHVGLVLPYDDKGLTGYMVNNYVKQGIVPKPKSKRYRPEHVAYLIIVTILKQSFSFSEIMQLIQAQIAASEVAHAYDLFCSALEAELRVLFGGEKITHPEEMTPAHRMLNATVTSIANKIYVERTLSFPISEKD